MNSQLLPLNTSCDEGISGVPTPPSMIAASMMHVSFEDASFDASSFASHASLSSSFSSYSSQGTTSSCMSNRKAGGLSRSRCISNLSALGGSSSFSSIPRQASYKYKAGPNQGWGYFVDTPRTWIGADHLVAWVPSASFLSLSTHQVILAGRCDRREEPPRLLKSQVQISKGLDHVHSTSNRLHFCKQVPWRVASKCGFLNAGMAVGSGRTSRKYCSPMPSLLMTCTVCVKHVSHLCNGIADNILLGSELWFCL